MRPEPRLIEIRKNVLKQNDLVARSLRERFRAALALARNPAERQFLEQRIHACEVAGAPLP